MFISQSEQQPDMLMMFLLLLPAFVLQENSVSLQVSVASLCVEEAGALPLK